MIIEKYKDLDVLFFEIKDEWLNWLEVNHNKYKAIWIKFAKKASGIKSITYEEAREGAIIYGWIDGLKNAFDEKYYVLRFTPRREKSVWSKINKEIAEELIRNETIKPSGLKEVEAAKKDGRWDQAYDSPSKIQIPEDFQKALDENIKAKKFFATINSTNRYAFLYRLQTTKKESTRLEKIKKFIEMLENKEVFYPNKKDLG